MLRDLERSTIRRIEAILALVANIYTNPQVMSWMYYDEEIEVLFLFYKLLFYSFLSSLWPSTEKKLTLP
jgi:hypothetical protein